MLLLLGTPPKLTSPKWKVPSELIWPVRVKFPPTAATGKLEHGTIMSPFAVIWLPLTMSATDKYGYCRAWRLPVTYQLPLRVAVLGEAEVLKLPDVPHPRSI